MCHQVYLRCGLYHGGEVLCEAQTTRPESQDKECCHWNENLEFQLKVCDIPRSAKLCYVLYSSRDSQAKKKRKGTQKEVRSESGDSVCQVEESMHVTTPLRAWPAAERCCTYTLYVPALLSVLVGVFPPANGAAQAAVAALST